VGAANVSRDTACLVSRNGNDSVRAAEKIASRSRNQAADFSERDKVLNLCGDSKCRNAVIFPMFAQNKFIKWLRLSEAGVSFSTTRRHYADK
jgi:hypothetical protein